MILVVYPGQKSLFIRYVRSSFVLPEISFVFLEISFWESVLSSQIEETSEKKVVHFYRSTRLFFLFHRVQLSDLSKSSFGWGIELLKSRICWDQVVHL